MYDDEQEDQVRPEWPKYLNVYEIEQIYGGPEEGGWFFNCGSPVESVRVDNQQELDSTRVRLEARYQMNDKSSWDRGRKRGSSSCAGGYDIQINIEDEFAKAYPQQRPRYE